MLRSLSKKFDMKVTTIEEAQDITSMKVDELFGSLLTFKMSLHGKHKKKNKGITLQSSFEVECDELNIGSEEFLANSIPLLSK